MSNGTLNSTHSLSQQCIVPSNFWYSLTVHPRWWKICSFCMNFPDFLMGRTLKHYGNCGCRFPNKYLQSLFTWKIQKTFFIDLPQWGVDTLPRIRPLNFTTAVTLLVLTTDYATWLLKWTKSLTLFWPHKHVRHILQQHQTHSICYNPKSYLTKIK